MLAVESLKYNGFLEFQTLTLVPIALNMVDQNLLTKEELDWLNSYNANVAQSFAGQ
jgi:Xaa-Pro aminopeptidase